MPQRVFAEFCRPKHLDRHAPVQLLLHGATYDHTYWSAYARLAAARGFATLNLDRLGYGRSDHPDPATLDVPAAAHVAHQVVDALRGGAFGPRFDRVVLNGHSLGGLIAHDTARRGGVTGLIISGMPTAAPAAATRAAFHPFHPAGEEPRFAHLPSGYLTTLPGTRVETFHFPGTYGPAVPHLEEGPLKDTVPEPELFALGTPPVPADVPTLSVVGAHDGFYPDGPGVVIPDAGHSINLSRGAPRFYAMTFDWLAHLPG
ncbi:Alpha/beta hydrolase family protein [Amycolatopsis sp. YIM 10]|nr:Alpha/beta hydrolase family protein [Amycolatopsis sp. YIM 10]